MMNISKWSFSWSCRNIAIPSDYYENVPAHFLYRLLFLFFSLQFLNDVSNGMRLCNIFSLSRPVERAGNVRLRKTGTPCVKFERVENKIIFLCLRIYLQ